MENKHAIVIGGTGRLGYAIGKNLEQEGYVVSSFGRNTSGLNEVIRGRGPISALIFCQRFRGDGDRWEGDIEATLTLTKDIVEEYADDFSAEAPRSIVMISSVGGYAIEDDQPLSYHVAKAGLIHMSNYYADSLANKGITVNCVSPSKFYYDTTRLNRQDIANVVSFLVSSKAMHITGQNIKWQK